jgi:H+/Cl- antiporter ClcA
VAPWIHTRAHVSRGRSRVGAGLGAVVFRELILAATRLFTGHSDYSSAGGAPNPHLGALGGWFVVAVPVIGGLIYGPLISRFASEARGHGVPEVMLAVSEGSGRIRPRVAAVKALASAICIGSGGSVGREGPIVQIGSALGSGLGQVLRIPESRLCLLVACGAAGGISATFNAPIAGVFFALELILRDFESESFGVVVLASAIADVIGRGAFGSQPFLSLPGFHERSYWEIGLYAGSGSRPRSSERRSSGCCTARRTSPTGCGADPHGCDRPPAGCCWARCSWRSPSCTASAIRFSSTRSAADTPPGSCCCCWPAR